MIFKVYEVIKDNILFRIEEDYPEVGAYLYVYEDGQCVRDFLQNNIDMCKMVALEKYNVLIDSWKRK